MQYLYRDSRPKRAKSLTCLPPEILSLTSDSLFRSNQGKKKITPSSLKLVLFCREMSKLRQKKKKERRHERHNKVWKLYASRLMGVLSGSPGGKVHVRARQIVASPPQVAPRLPALGRRRSFSRSLLRYVPEHSAAF